MKPRRPTYREKHRAPGSRLNDALERLYYEIVALSIVESRAGGELEGKPEPRDVSDREFRRVIRRLSAWMPRFDRDPMPASHVAERLAPLFDAARSEARALGMTRQEYADIAQVSFLKVWLNLNTRRLEGRIKRLEAEREKP